MAGIKGASRTKRPSVAFRCCAHAYLPWYRGVALDGTARLESLDAASAGRGRQSDGFCQFDDGESSIALQFREDT
jgi:hypothetical protein